MRYALVLLVLVSASFTIVAQADDKTSSPMSFPKVEITEGAAWPGFYLPDLDGKPLSVQDYRGRKVVLHIFASW